MRAGRRKFSLIKQDSRMKLMAHINESKNKGESQNALIVTQEHTDALLAHVPRITLERSMSVGNIVVGYFATEHEKEMVDIDLEGWKMTIARTLCCATRHPLNHRIKICKK